MFPGWGCRAHPGWSWVSHLFIFNVWGTCCWYGIQPANSCAQEFCLFFSFLLQEADRRQHKAMKISSCTQTIISIEIFPLVLSFFCKNLITISFKAECGTRGACFESHYFREEKKYMSCVECWRISESHGKLQLKGLWSGSYSPDLFFSPSQIGLLRLRNILSIALFDEINNSGSRNNDTPPWSKWKFTSA